MAFAGAAAYSYLEDAVAVLVSLIVGVPLLASVLKLKVFGKQNQ
jgi:hypothetical protein